MLFEIFVFHLFENPNSYRSRGRCVGAGDIACDPLGLALERFGGVSRSYIEVKKHDNFSIKDESDSDYVIHEKSNQKYNKNHM